FQAVARCSARDTATFDCPLGQPALERLPSALTSLRSGACSGVLRASGGGKRNSEGGVSTQGVIVASCGVAPDALAGGVGRQKPSEFGVPAMLWTRKNGGGVGANPSVSLKAPMASATLCPHAPPAP